MNDTDIIRQLRDALEASNTWLFGHHNETGQGRRRFCNAELIAAADACLSAAPQASEPAAPAAGEVTALQGGLSNHELMAAWQKKLPGVAPTDRELSAFAVGIEVGFAHAQELEKASWMRIHYVLKDAGIHPGRTDDHLADVIARALAAPTPPADIVRDAEPLTDEQLIDLFCKVTGLERFSPLVLSSGEDIAIPTNCVLAGMRAAIAASKGA